MFGNFHFNSERVSISILIEFFNFLGDFHVHSERVVQSERISISIPKHL